MLSDTNYTIIVVAAKNKQTKYERGKKRTRKTLVRSGSIFLAKVERTNTKTAVYSESKRLKNNMQTVRIFKILHPACLSTCHLTTIRFYAGSVGFKIPITCLQVVVLIDWLTVVQVTVGGKARTRSCFR